MNFMERTGLISPLEPLDRLELTDQMRLELFDEISDERSKYRLMIGNYHQCIKGRDVADWYHCEKKIWVRFYKRDPDNFSDYLLWDIVKKTILYGTPEIVLQLVEDISQLVSDKQPSFPEALNSLFYRYKSPYLLKKTSEWGWAIHETGSGYEKECFLEAISEAQKLGYVNYHIQKAAIEIKKEDFPDACDQAWKSVEACLKILTKNDKAYGLKAINEFVKLYPEFNQFKNTLIEMAKFRNDEEDVGHAIKEGKLPTLKEAKLMFGFACALIPYLTSALHKQNALN